MGRFKSDDQRKAMFANMFSGSDSKKSRVNSSNIKNMNTEIVNKPRKIEKQKVSFSESRSRKLRGHHRIDKQGNHDKSCPHYSQMMESGSRKMTQIEINKLKSDLDGRLDDRGGEILSDKQGKGLKKAEKIRNKLRLGMDYNKMNAVINEFIHAMDEVYGADPHFDSMELIGGAGVKVNNRISRDLKKASYKDIEKIKKDTKIGLLLTGHIRNHYRKMSLNDMKDFISNYRPDQQRKLEAHFKKFFSDAKNVKSVAEFKKLSDKQYKDVGDIMFAGSTGYVGPNWDSESEVIFNNLPKGLLKSINERANELGYKNVKGYQL